MKVDCVQRNYMICYLLIIQHGKKNKMWNKPQVKSQFQIMREKCCGNLLTISLFVWENYLVSFPHKIAYMLFVLKTRALWISRNFVSVNRRTQKLNNNNTQRLNWLGHVVIRCVIWAAQNNIGVCVCFELIITNHTPISHQRLCMCGAPPTPQCNWKTINNVICHW